MRNKSIYIIKSFLSVFFFFLLGALGITFSILYVNTIESGLIYNYSNLFKCIAFIIITLLTIFTTAYFINDKKFIYKLFLLVVFFISFATFGLYLLKVTGFLDKIKSVDEFRQYISSFGFWAILIYLVCQILQVAILPIPAMVIVGSGVLMFGPLLASILSCIGVIIGSLIAFFVGKIFGYKVVKWLVGKESLDKCLNFIKGKDKIFFTFMFLFPFFPDDLLCFVAGITTMTPLYFAIMISIVRIITVFLSCYSINNSLIPYNTWWGILLWVLFFITTICISILLYKKSDKIEKFIKDKILRKYKQK